MHSFKKFVGVALAAAVVAAGPMTTLAGEVPASGAGQLSASNLKELAEIVSGNAMDKVESYEVEYTGNMADIDNVLLASYDFFFSGLSLLDDPKTHEDADYVTSNLNLYDENATYVDVEDNTVLFNLKYFETKEQTDYVKQQIPSILEELGVDEMSNYEKVQAIHDYVCRQITYTDTGSDLESTMYGAIKNGQGLCQSYAITMYRLLVESGIPAKLVLGTAGTGRDADSHAWNLVALGDQWYFLDATWDDMEEGEAIYDYFLKGSSDFDEADPSQPHALFDEYGKGEFARKFPVAETAFDPENDDNNYTVTIGSDYEPEYEPVDPGEEYTLEDISDGVWPEDGFFKVKKGKWGEIALFIKNGMEDLIAAYDYEVVSGEKCIKKADIELLEDEDGKMIDMSFKGKKKGKVEIVFLIELTNGQILECTFSGKVK